MTSVPELIMWRARIRHLFSDSGGGAATTGKCAWGSCGDCAADHRSSATTAIDFGGRSSTSLPSTSPPANGTGWIVSGCSKLL
jgi:hypothetical protein